MVKGNRVWYILSIFIISAVLAFIPAVRAQECEDAESDQEISVNMKVGGFIQTEYRYFGPDDTTNDDTFAFRRIRLRIHGDLTPEIGYYFVPDFTPTDFAPHLEKAPLVDAFIILRHFPNVKLSIGQFKSPFSMELNTDCSRLDTVDRSNVVRNLAAPGRDIGIMASGDLSKVWEDINLSWSLAVMNGYKLNNKDNNDSKDIVGRLVWSPNGQLSLGASFRHGRQPTYRKVRAGVESRFTYDSLTLKGEYLYGEDDLFAGDTTKKDGFYLQATYNITPKFQPLVKFERYDPNRDLGKDHEDIYTGGFSYFFDEKLRLQVNYQHKDEEPDTDNDILYTQLQLKF